MIDAPLAPDGSGLSDGPAVDGGAPDADRGDAPTGAGVIHVSFLGSGAGTVSAGSISCTSDCSRVFQLGVPVTFTATPALGSLFAGWSGSCTGNGSCEVIPGATERTLEATFLPVATVQLVTHTTGPGTLSVQPAGASCGTDCQAYASGTTLRIVPTPDPGLSFIGFTGGGCEDAGTSPCTLILNGNVEVSGAFCSSHRVVDASAGADTNDGTCAHPFRTIAKALSVATSGQLVTVHPGVYANTLGEIFPLVVPDGVRLVGDEAQKGGATRIQGGGAVEGSPGLRAAVVVGAGATLAGFVIVNSVSLPSSNGVVVTKPTPGAAAAAVVRNNTITGCTTDGVYLERAPMAQIDGNVITDQKSPDSVGVRITGDAPNASVERNSILRNTYGVEINTAADLGGGNRQSAGRNVFSCNVEIDVLAAGSAQTITVSADMNSWDHVPPETSSACASNLDVCNDNADVSLAGALLAPSPCP